MATTELLAPKTGADQTKNFYVPKDQVVTIMASPILDGSETADVQISHDEGHTFQDYIDSTAVELTATKNAIRLYGPMMYRVDKDITASATGIYLHYLES